MKNIYLERKNKKDCNGCGVCIIGCPTKAIKMIEDNEGFYYPQIDENKCINCGKCKNICSNYNESKNNEDSYMIINKDKEVLNNSASGGMFYVLVKFVIDNKGVVFGVEYGEDLKVQHNYYETLEDCKKFQGSKYVRSDISNLYQKVEEFLKQDRMVLFTGTPCQCNALRVYLKKDYEKLIICELICHANPSQKVFDKYIKEIEENKNKRILKYEFRTKINGWRNQTPVIEYEDGTREEDGTFFKAFVSELIGRPSCHDCKFSNINRNSDFTIGDFWGIENVLPDVKNDDTGISLVTVNTEKAKKIFEKIKDKVTFIKVKKEDAFKYNHHGNVPMHKNRQKFFDNLETKPIIENMKECLKKPLYRKVLGKCKRVIKNFLNKF